LEEPPLSNCSAFDGHMVAGNDTSACTWSSTAPNDSALNPFARALPARVGFEPVFRTAIGGVIGILVGGGISVAVDKLSPLPSRVSMVWVVLAFCVAVSVGLFFGIYPAARAAKLDPIESLRYE
jgi:ABC-type antimicrobial peptide transport system permease subunit